MKYVGITRSIDHLGRIVLPMEYRKLLGMDTHTEIEIIRKGDEIIIRKHNPGCTICGQKVTLQVIEDKGICSDCIRKIKNRA